MALRLAILTISDAGSRGERSDSSGDLIASWARERGYTLAERALIPDETTRAVLQKEAPGIAEALRMSAFPRFPRAALSRGLAGVRSRTLIVNLPGSPGGVRDGLVVLAVLVEHAVELVRGVKMGHSVVASHESRVASHERRIATRVYDPLTGIIQSYGGKGVGHWTLDVPDGFGGWLTVCDELLTSGQIVYRRE
jgi:molybdopterin biosynthesis enzyme MoaB